MPTLRRQPLVAVAVLAVSIVVATTIVLRTRPTPPPVAAVKPAPDIVALPSLSAPPPPGEPSKMLRRDLVEALGFGSVPSWARRTELIRTIPPSLSAPEVEALLAALMAPCPRQVAPEIHSTYVHEIACVLQPVAAARERFVRALATIARDARRDPATRDYAVQHLRQAWGRAGGDPALRTAIVSTFREFTRLDPVLSTSALLSLHILGTAGDGPPRGATPAVAGKVGTAGAPPAVDFQVPDTELLPLLNPIIAAKTSTAGAAARLTAVRIIGERRLNAFRQPLLGIVQDGSENALVRMAAAHSLGQIGDPADLKTLASLAPDDARVASAVQSALKPRSPR